MTGAPGRHAGPVRRDEEPVDWLSAPSHSVPQAGLPSGLSSARSRAEIDDWRSGPGEAPAFEDAYTPYSSRTAPSYVGVPEPDAWPTPSFTRDEPARDDWHRPAAPPAREHRSSHRGDAYDEPERRPGPLVFGFAGLMVGLVVSVAVIKVVGALFPSLLPSL